MQHEQSWAWVRGNRLSNPKGHCSCRSVESIVTRYGSLDQFPLRYSTGHCCTRKLNMNTQKSLGRPQFSIEVGSRPLNWLLTSWYREESVMLSLSRRYGYSSIRSSAPKDIGQSGFVCIGPTHFHYESIALCGFCGLIVYEAVEHRRSPGICMGY
jgi:hypothetical protein